MASLPGSVFQTSPTDSAPASSSTIVPFAFENIVYPESCSSTVIDWIRNGPDLTFDFVVKSSIAPHTDIAFPRKRDVANLIIASNLHTTSQTYTWSPVDVPQGWYTIIAQGQGWQVPSSQFFVTNGTDESCISPSSSSSTPTPGSNTSSASVASLASSLSIPPSATSLPIVTAPTRPHMGAIIGGVIAGVLIFATAIAACIYFGSCWRSPTRSRRRAMDGPAQRGKWEGLPSRNSYMDAPSPLAMESTLPMALTPVTKTLSSSSPIPSAMSESVRMRPLSYRPISLGTASTDASIPDGLLSSRHHSYQTSAWAGSSRRDSPVPSSATSQMYRDRDLDGYSSAAPSSPASQMYAGRVWDTVDS